MNTLRGAAIFAAFTAGGMLSAQAEPILKICDDDAGWPPYTFADSKDTKDPKVIRGASADLVVEILKRAGYDPVITLLPWKRCLKEVEAGESAMAINASYSDERAKTYWLSQPYYTLTSALFYRTQKYPKAPVVASLADMQKYRYCGLFGYNYAMYALPEALLDTGAKNEPSRFAMLARGRCDFVIGDVEVLTAFAAMGQLDLSGTAYIPIPEAKPKEFHMIVSRTEAGGEKLLKVLNDGLVALKADKTYAKIFRKYGI